MGDSYNDKNAQRDPLESTNKKKLNALDRPHKRHKAKQKLGEIVQNNNWDEVDDDEYDDLYDSRNY